MTQSQNLHGGQNRQENSPGPEDKTLFNVGKPQDVLHFCDALCIFV